MTQTAASGQSRDGPCPKPGLTAEGVVRRQTQALQNNDTSDHGIEINYDFASSASKGQTGPCARSARMLKKPPYAIMPDARKLTYRPQRVMEDRAELEVTVNSATGLGTTFLLHLKRQQAAPHTDCRMTGAAPVKGVVNRLDVGGQATQPDPGQRTGAGKAG